MPCPLTSERPIRPVAFIAACCACLALYAPVTARSATDLRKREHRQTVTLHRYVGTLMFFRRHRWLARTRVGRREVHKARVWVRVVRRELAETRASLRPASSPPSVDGCLSELIQRESGWDVRATNRSTGAYGLPQALPGSKMASAGADWATNPATQILWMLGYVRRYGGSCAALSFQKTNGWY